MERALERPLGSEESEVARRITLRAHAVDAFQQARKFDPTASNLDELISKVSDISNLFPQGKDIPFREKRRPPFEEAGPIDAEEILDIETVEVGVVGEPEDLLAQVIQDVQETMAIYDVERNPHPLDLFRETCKRYEAFEARNAVPSVARPLEHVSPNAPPTRLTSMERNQGVSSTKDSKVAVVDKPQEEPDAPTGMLHYVGALLADQLDNGKITEKTADQTKQAISLLVEATGKKFFSNLTQKDLSRFKKTMASLPPSYRKSVADRYKSLEQIISEAEELRSVRERGVRQRVAPVIGLSAATINRNLSFVSKILRYARADGEDIDPRLDPALLREDKKTRDREDRPPFTHFDVDRIFAHPVWQGCRSAARRNLPGLEVIKNGLYWLPLLAAHSGARLEEIAGLRLNDVVLAHDIPHLRIIVNQNRRLKNPQSERLVPIHPMLLSLGFAEYVRFTERTGAGDVFPDMRPQGKGSFGEKIDHPFRTVVEQQLGEDAWVNGRKKTFHSFRHYVIGQLSEDTPRQANTKKDVVGHLAEDVTSENYGSEANLDLKLEALVALPPLTALTLPSAARDFAGSTLTKPRPKVRIRQSTRSTS
jgi:integrase